jgi:hypothetical protein
MMTYVSPTNSAASKTTISKYGNGVITAHNSLTDALAVSKLELISLEDGMGALEFLFSKIEFMLENIKEKQRILTSVEYSGFYTIVYRMDRQAPPHYWARQLYEAHGNFIKHYLMNMLVSLKEKNEESLLRDFILSYEKHELMSKQVGRVFMYLGSYYIKHQSLPCFKDDGKIYSVL